VYNYDLLSCLVRYLYPSIIFTFPGSVSNVNSWMLFYLMIHFQMLVVLNGLVSCKIFRYDYCGILLCNRDVNKIKIKNGRSPFAPISLFQRYHLRQLFFSKDVNCDRIWKSFAPIYLYTYFIYLLTYRIHVCISVFVNKIHYW